MKAFTISFFIVLISLTAIYAQIPNASFENWTDGAPDGWTTNRSPAQGLLTVTQSSDAENGSSAAEISVANFAGIGLGPIMWTGSLTRPGFTVSEKYGRLSGFYKFSPLQGDLFLVIVTMLKNNIAIGGGHADIPTSASTYTSFNVNITYETTGVPDTCIISFAIANQDSTQGPHIGSTALIDNLSLSNATSVKQTEAPNRFSLSQNFPNPFNPSTVISYKLAVSSQVALRVYNILGEKVSTLVNKEEPAGRYEVELNGANLSSGIYFYFLQAGSYRAVKKMILMK